MSIQILYDAPNGRIQIWKYATPTGWVQQGADIPIVFVDGDVFSVHTNTNGAVEIYRNGILLVTRTLAYNAPKLAQNNGLFQPVSYNLPSMNFAPLQQGSPVTINYIYDSLNRLKEANYSNGDYYHYTYDAVGNRLSQTTSIGGLSSTTNYVYDNANRLASVGGVTYVYDNNGNLKNDGVNSYDYDSANRLKTLTGSGTTATYQYNGLGDRLRETVNGITTTFTMDLNTGLTQALSDGTNTYIYGLGRIAQTHNTITEYFLGDALGSVRQLTDTSGAITFARAYDPYGVVTSTAGSSQSSYGYTGESYGDSTELLYLRSRYYASNTGRFLTRDTWGGDANSPMSFNRWNYVDGNPANRTDPFGLFPLETITNNISITDFAIDNSSVVSPVDRSRWGFLAALRKAEDYDYLRVGALDLTSLYPKLAVSRTEMIWSINCDVIMVGGRTLSTYFENEVKRQRMPYIYWRDTSARYYDLFNSLKPSQSFVDGGFVNDYPPYRSISLGYFAEINIIADINGQLHASLSAGPGGTFGWAYTEGYLCPIQMEGCGDMPPISEVTDALNGFCFPEGNIQLLGGIAVAFCEALTDNRQDPMAFTGIVTYYAGLQVGLGGGGTVTVSLPYQNPMLGWGWAVNDQLNGWNISSAWLNYR